MRCRYQRAALKRCVGTSHQKGENIVANTISSFKGIRQGSRGNFQSIKRWNRKITIIIYDDDTLHDSSQYRGIVKKEDRDEK